MITSNSMQDVARLQWWFCVLIKLAHGWQYRSTYQANYHRRYHRTAVGVHGVQNGLDSHRRKCRRPPNCRNDAIRGSFHNYGVQHFTAKVIETYCVNFQARYIHILRIQWYMLCSRWWSVLLHSLPPRAGISVCLTANKVTTVMIIFHL